MSKKIAGPEIERLVALLARLPGLGPRSARKAALGLLKKRHDLLVPLADAMRTAVEKIIECPQCGNLDTVSPCTICQDPRRDRSQLCVVETPADQAALERTGAYKGLFFVLMGKLSPLDGVGPNEIGLRMLFDRVDTLVEGEREVREVILATNFTAEGETTAHVIAQGLKARSVKVTRLARGVPVGSELEYVDLGTIAHALVDRR